MVNGDGSTAYEPPDDTPEDIDTHNNLYRDTYVLHYGLIDNTRSGSRVGANIVIRRVDFDASRHFPRLGIFLHSDNPVNDTFCVEFSEICHSRIYQIVLISW